jgi:hypothetical protein
MRCGGDGVANVSIHGPTGVLVVDGQKVFPIGISDPPPVDALAPSGEHAFQELANGGVTMIRSGTPDWALGSINHQIAAEQKLQDTALAHGLQCWMRLGPIADLPGATANQQLLQKIVTTFKVHPALCAYKGVDEPRNPFRGTKWIRPAGLVRAHDRIKALDPNHPLVIIQAPRSPVSQLVPYRPAFDITGVDIFPVAYPPGLHSDNGNTDISVVGDMAYKMDEASGGKPFWLTLQIAWSGVAPSKENPDIVPRFPSLLQERFMAYQAIVHNARGLVFFGGHMTEVCTPDDAKAGWNWTFWRQVLRPLVHELSSSDLRPALLVPNAKMLVRTKPQSDIEMTCRRAGSYLYVIAVKRGGSPTLVDFFGLPKRQNGKPLTKGEVLFEYVQRPPPMPRRPDRQVPRTVKVSAGGFRDWFSPHDVHIYRFDLA